MNKRWAPFALLAAAAASALFLACHGRSPGNSLAISGNIEVTEAQIGFRVSGKVAERAVDEGQTVKAGQVIARLDARDLEQVAAARRADEATASAALAEMLAGSRKEEIEAAGAQLDQAKADLSRVEADEARNRELFEKEVISGREYDASRAAFESSKARVREAEQRYALVKKGPREEDIAQARGRLEQAKQARALSETQLSYATLASPMDGVVLSKNVEPGEFVAPGTPVVTVGDLRSVWLRGYIEETELGRVKVGQKATLTTDTYLGKRYEGRVSFISSEAEFTPKMVQTKKERVKLVYRVKIDVPNPDMELKPGMPADATIATGG